ncbi:tRNA pseudouridine synthase D (TruD) [Fragilaria crotonensis]|nr:tRNA pseudouridine synthase D (TruD) [Fragilaria crotonensis]
MSDSRMATRSYSTLGIHSVFLSPIAKERLPQAYLASPSDCFTTPEIIGTIKAEPEDFCVRELATGKLKLPSQWRVAGLRDVNRVLPVQETATVANPEEKEIDVLQLEKDLQPLEVVSRVLQSHHAQTWNAELSDLHTLQETAQRSLQTLTNNEGIVWIPPVPSDSSCLTNTVQRSGDRGSLHRCLKLAFPLLQSETVKQEDGLPLIKVTIDTSFFALAPTVHDPILDTMQALYKFRRQGAPAVRDSQHTRKRKRSFNHLMEGDPFSFVLPLRQGISKDERRKIHHVISAQTRDFETSTISDYKVAHGITTTALVLTWSKAALRIAASSYNGKSSPSCHLIVLKKRQKEHLAAMQTLARILRCRQSDIGTAGIKDMHAVTYQFCTIRGVTPDRLWQANADLRQHGMEIGSVQLVDHFLQPGQLDGNRFVINVRDVKRVHVDVKDGRVREDLRPCQEEDRDYILARADAVRKFGFVNFYGEQRLGIPGEREAVGVRSFDIGRAMLQGDFDKAVDLLMTGRLICRGVDDQENPSARMCRQIWKETDGNAEATYNALPKGESMTRERTVLQGLKRYQNSLDALKCLHFRERSFWIHAYQSYVWNAMASMRLQRFGSNVVAGDLAIRDDDKVVVVSDDMVSSFCFSQIVLPLPGYNVQYPTNQMGDQYREFLENEKVSFEKGVQLEATAKGSYRRLVVSVNSLELDFVSSTSSAGVSFQVSFDLPLGSYATMLLRELMVTTVVRI